MGKFKKVEMLEEVKKLKGEEKFLYEIEDLKFKLIQNLTKERISKGLTQKDIAGIIGMSQQAVSRMEKFGNDPSLYSLLKYLKVLDLDINDLFKK